MRIVWKDSKPNARKPIKYRGFYAKGHEHGWVITVPGDENIYRTHYCALNAIDKALGGEPRVKCKDIKRQKYGIQIIGTKNDVG